MSRASYPSERHERDFALPFYLTVIEKQRQALINQRDDADAKSMELIQLVVNSVKGDPEEGEDGDLYEAMGYVRRSERHSGLHRGSDRTTPAAPATH